MKSTQRDPSPRRAAASLATLSLVFGLAYWLCNRFTSARADIGLGVFDWERAIPFVPWTIVPYLSIGVFFAASFFISRDPAELDRHVKRLALVLSLSIACYLLYPLRFTFERPATDGVFGLLFAGLSAFDLPYNRAPSLHISVLLILWVRFAPRWQGGHGLALHLWFTLIGISVLTTYQHHVIDVAGGLVAGALCIAVTSGQRGRVQARAARSRIGATSFPGVFHVTQSRLGR